MKKRSLYNAALIICLMMCLGYERSAADTVYLKNGGELEGVIVNEDERAIDIEMGGGIVRIDKDRVREAVRSDPEANRQIMESFAARKADLERRGAEFSKERDRRFDEYRQWQEEEQKKKADAETETKEVQAISGKAYEGGRASDNILVEAVINDRVAVTLVLDTGATDIMLQRNIGEKLGFDMNDTKNDMVETMLADGRKVREKMVILKKVSVQGMEEKDVSATIALEDVKSPVLRDGLLGMSFLNRFNFTIDRKTMKITLERLGKK